MTDPEAMELLVKLYAEHVRGTEKQAARLLIHNAPTWRAEALARIKAGKVTAAELFDPRDKWELNP
jgi:hypothetical protein